MGCGCGQKKKDIGYVTDLAEKYVKVTKQDVQVYEIKKPNGEIIYDFEPVSSGRETVVFYINYSDYSDRQP